MKATYLWEEWKYYGPSTTCTQCKLKGKAMMFDLMNYRNQKTRGELAHMKSVLWLESKSKQWQKFFLQWEQHLTLGRDSIVVRFDFQDTAKQKMNGNWLIRDSQTCLKTTLNTYSSLNPSRCFLHPSFSHSCPCVCSLYTPLAGSTVWPFLFVRISMEAIFLQFVLCLCAPLATRLALFTSVSEPPEIAFCLNLFPVD